MDHLQEAYFAIYEESEIADRARRAVKHQRGGTHGDDDAMEKESEASTKSVKKATKYKGPKVTPSIVEEVHLYDVVLDYLLDEGYADTEENAITIMANMSEEWIDDILDEAKVDQDLTPLQKIRKRNKEYALPGEPAGQQTSNRRAERSSTRGVKQKKGAKSAFGTMRNIGGPYN